jgi:hypothetical protein
MILKMANWLFALTAWFVSAERIRSRARMLVTRTTGADAHDGLWFRRFVPHFA